MSCDECEAQQRACDDQAPPKKIITGQLAVQGFRKVLAAATEYAEEVTKKVCV